jgi:hypothetical protein
MRLKAMRKWLRSPLPEIPQTPESSPGTEVRRVSGISGKQPFHQAPPEDVEERAAIVNHDGGVLRRWAEGLARLDPDRPPRGFSPARWLQLVNDSGLLLDRWGTNLDALGWTDTDVWGCDLAAPDQRLDNAGLALAVSGREVMCVTSSTATIKTTGGTLTFYRRRRGEPQVLLWELPE